MTTNDSPVDLKELTPLAFAIDGEVVLIMHTNEKIAAVLQSEPVVVAFTKTNTDEDPRVGDLWDGTKIVRKSD